MATAALHAHPHTAHDHEPSDPTGRALRIGIGGPVGSGKTALVAALCNLDTRFPGLELVLVESGGDNLTAVFSRGLVDAQVFVLDVAGGDKVPRKGGPGLANGWETAIRAAVALAG